MLLNKHADYDSADLDEDDDADPDGETTSPAGCRFDQVSPRQSTRPRDGEEGLNWVPLIRVVQAVADVLSRIQEKVELALKPPSGAARFSFPSPYVALLATTFEKWSLPVTQTDLDSYLSRMDKLLDEDFHAHHDGCCNVLTDSD
jgi:hypothetical protein